MNPAHMQIRAFPSHGTMGEVIDEGMFLRDYFAAMAMQGIMTQENNGYGSWERLANDAYILADAMLEKRGGE